MRMPADPAWYARKAALEGSSEIGAGKRCFTYCGDERCNCEAGPLCRPVWPQAPDPLPPGGPGYGWELSPGAAADIAEIERNIIR